MENTPRPPIKVKRETKSLKSKELALFDLYYKSFQEAGGGNFSPGIERNEDGEILAANSKTLVSKLVTEDLVKITRTPSFKKWFGDWTDPENEDVSKVINKETKEPLILFHGLETEIDFKVGPKLHGDNLLQRHIAGMLYATSNQEHAYLWSALFSKDNGKQLHIFPLFMNIRKPMYFDDHKKIITAFSRHEDFIKKHNDGIIQTEGKIFVPIDKENPDQFAVFTEGQIMWIPYNV